jgi:hypothetical protein
MVSSCISKIGKLNLVGRLQVATEAKKRIIIAFFSSGYYESRKQLSRSSRCGNESQCSASNRTGGYSEKYVSS